MKNADLKYDAKYPYILPKESYFTALVIINAHKEVKHNGMKETLRNLRTEFWVTRSRNFIKKIIHSCITCRYVEGKSYDYPKTPALPKFRVQKDFAFSITGLDYAGHLYVKNVYTKSEKEEMHKCWLALFTCANSRCLFLDLVPNNSAETCVLALKRFISSRGVPKLIISDNGSAFVSKQVQEFAASKFIEWKFNTEAAPWKGGFFERMVKSVKRCLKKVLMNTRLNYEELLTTIKEIENIINNRPLTYIYDDVSQDILTPNKLLFGRNLEVKAPEEEIGIEKNLSA